MNHAHTEPEPARLYAAILAAGALLMLGFMAAHPAIHAHDAAGFLDEMRRKGPLSAVVHGALIAAMLVTLVGLLGVVARLGPRRPAVRAGLIAYSVGTLAHTAAATINGFVVPGITARFAAAPAHGHAAPDPAAVQAAALDQLRPILVLCGETNGAAARLGVAAMSAAILLWSFRLLRDRGVARLVGASGLVCGAIPPTAFAAGLAMDVHGFMIRVILQSVWYLAAAYWLWTTAHEKPPAFAEGS
jgi:hypothetical protein